MVLCMRTCQGCADSVVQTAEKVGLIYVIAADSVGWAVSS